MKGIAHSGRHLLCLVLEIAGGVHQPDHVHQSKPETYEP
jgi:hypothetical protein